MYKIKMYPKRFSVASRVHFVYKKRSECDMEQKILEVLKKAKGYVSGEQIGEQLGVSRTAIWKGIKKLREQGYEIEAVSTKDTF